MSTAQGEADQNGESDSSAAKLETSRPQGNSIWTRKEEDDDGTLYFMSEPSISEDGSDLGLRSPRGTGSPDPHLHLQEGIQSHFNVPAPPQRPQSPPAGGGFFPAASPHPSEYPSSPGGTTSLSSRESPFWPSKYHFMAYPPGESDQSWVGSTDGQPSRIKVESTSGRVRLNSNASKSPQPQPPTYNYANEGIASEQEDRKERMTPLNEELDTDHIKQPTLKSKSPHSNSSSASDDGPRRADEFLHKLKFKSIGALKVASPGDYVSDRTLNEADDEEEVCVNDVVRPRKTVLGVNGDQNDSKDIPQNGCPAGGENPDETLSMSLSNSFDDGKPSGGDAEKSERSRRTKTLSRTAPNHRRTRSGDDVAAMIMTGGTEWRGMGGGILPAPPLFGGYYEDEDYGEELGQAECRPNRDRRGLTPRELAIQASAGFGNDGKKYRSSRRVRNQQGSQRPNLGQHDLWSLSDSTLSTGLRVDTAHNSTSMFPSYVERRQSHSGSVSTLELVGAESRDRSQSQSDVDSTQKELVERNEDSGQSGSGASHKRNLSRGSAVTSETSSADSRASSKFSWISQSVHASGDFHVKKVCASVDPTTQEVTLNQKIFREDRDASGSETSYTTSDVDAPKPVCDNMLNRQNAGTRMRSSTFAKQEQKVPRPQQSPFANIGKTTRKFLNRESYAPSTISEDAGKYPTFICPNCKTRQREFFSTSTAPAQDSAAGYLALYFFIYVIASLYIFGLQEGWNALDCVYFAVITLTTAGLGDFVPTSDGAKVICSIFIYFGVACIGLLLGSYLAGSLDEASHVEAQANRAESCRNCQRLKTLKATAKATRRSSAGSVRVSPREASSPIAMAKMFMSENPRRGQVESHQAVYEHADKRRKHHVEKTDRPAPYPRMSSESSQSSDPFEFGAESNWSTGAPHSETEYQKSESQNRSDGIFHGGSPLGVINEQVDPGFAPPATPTQYISPAPPAHVLGSPVTANILNRQQHTRHVSLDFGSSGFFDNDPSARRVRLFSEEIGRRQMSPAIIEGQPAPPPPFSLNEETEVYETEDEDESSDESSESDSSESSLFGASDIKKPISRLKTAKYILLTLKQAVVNSIFIIAIGSVGFYLIEKMSAVDSFYFTTVLLTTVGYGDIVPVTAPGKLFATVYVLVAGTVLLHNMSTISMIPLELRKRRIERAVLTQFGDQLDDASLRELATGPLIRRLQLSAKTQSGLDECTREMFALAMLVRLGKVTEQDVKMTFAAFRRLDVGNDGVLNSQDIIVGMMQKRRQSSVQNLVALGKEAAGDVPQPLSGRPWYFFRQNGAAQRVDDEPQMPSPYENEQEAIDPEHESLLQNFSMPSMESRRYNTMNNAQGEAPSYYNTMNNAHGEAPSYDSTFRGMGYPSSDLETGYDYQYVTRTSHRGLSESPF